jgi:spermidine synthase
LFVTAPKHIVQLGLGTGALTKFCYRHFVDAQVTAIELNPAVIQICSSMFKFPAQDARLQVCEMDAMDFVAAPENHNKIDIFQIDLYDATARGPVLDTAEFYAACAACLTADGVATINLFGDHPSFIKNLKAMRHAFAEVICLPEVHDGNIIALAFRRPQTLVFTALCARAAEITLLTKLPTKSWINGLKIWQSSGGFETVLKKK